jgi:hypothetical protein
MNIKRAAAMSCLLPATICGAGEVYARGEGRAEAVGVRCATPPNAMLHAARRKDALMACHGARDATAFLASQGLEIRGPMTIDVVSKLPTVASDSAAGCYVENRAVVLTYSEFSKQGTWFEIRVDRALYRSLVAHEVAHAIAATNFSMPSPTIQAHEYIAYVTMLATMAPAQRERVLSKYPGQGFDDDVQMSATIYLFDPMRFAVQSYRHYLKQTSGRAYLHALLSGDALAE